MPKLSASHAAACITVAVLMLIPTALVLSSSSSNASPEGLFDEGMVEFERSNFGAASELFNRSYHGFIQIGDEDKALQSLSWKMRADRTLLEYWLDRRGAEEQLAEAFPWVPSEERSSWLDDPAVEMITSDGRELYFGFIAENIAYRNLSLYHQLHTADWPGNMLRGMMIEVLRSDAERTGAYFNPVNYLANGTLTLERGLLPATGTLSLWIPAPIETVSQVNVSVRSIEPMAWVKNVTIYGSSLGQVYLEVPLDEVEGDVMVKVAYTYTSYQKHIEIDPSDLGEYDHASLNYTKYTSSGGNILITPGIIDEARAVVGEETNPYLQAKLLYDHVLENIKYSYVPHISLSAREIPESEYVRTNRYGDCGAQSMYYCALLRSLGIPARAEGGYQGFDHGTGPHFWAEVLLPNGTWFPVDVAAASAMDWIPPSTVTREEMDAFKGYYFGNLDHMRYIIQEDVDIALSPQPATPSPFSAAFQDPVAVCMTSDEDVSLMAQVFWKFEFTAMA